MRAIKCYFTFNALLWPAAGEKHFVVLLLSNDDYEYFGSAAGENFANSHIGSCGNSARKLKSKLWKIKRKLWKASKSEKEVVENGKL